MEPRLGDGRSGTRPAGTAPRSSCRPARTRRCRRSRSEVGIDLGLTHFAVSVRRHEGPRPEVPAPCGPQARAAAAGTLPQEKGSDNRTKAVVKVARAHARVADTRRTGSTNCPPSIRDNQAVYVEDLCVAGLGRTRLAKSVHDAGWASFTGHVGVQGRPVRADIRPGGPVLAVHPDVLATADGINDKMALNVRAWDCPCGSTTTGTSTPPSTCSPPDRRRVETTVERR